MPACRDFTEQLVGLEVLFFIYSFFSEENKIVEQKGFIPYIRDNWKKGKDGKFSWNGRQLKDAGHELRLDNKKKVTQEVTDIPAQKQNKKNFFVYKPQKCNNQCNKEVSVAQ